MTAPAPTKPALAAIRLHPNDSVLVARVDLAQGSVLAEANLTCLNRELLGLGEHEFVPWQIGITG